MLFIRDVVEVMVLGCSWWAVITVSVIVMLMTLFDFGTAGVFGRPCFPPFFALGALASLRLGGGIGPPLILSSFPLYAC